MTPHLRTFIDAIESAAGKRDAAELTDIEKISLCINAGVELGCKSGFCGRHCPDPRPQIVDLFTNYGVIFEHDGGN